MQIQSGIGGGDSTSPRDFVQVVKVNSKRRLEIEILGEDGNLTDISEITLPSGEPDGLLDLSFTSLEESLVYEESYWPNPVPSSRRITHADTGKYYLTLGDVASETASTGTYIANWTARLNATSEEMVSTQVVEIVSSRVLSLLPRFKLMVDRSWKVVDVNAACMLGYNNAMLIMFLRSGLELINSFQPYVNFYNLDSFPIDQYAEILIKAATYVALESQMLFALDTDSGSYNSASHSYILLHQQPLAAYLSQLRAEITDRIPKFKLHLVNSGTCKVCANINYAWASLLSSSPFGANYRNMWTAR
jgi:hypothetical protein